MDFNEIYEKFIEIFERIMVQRGYNPLIGRIIALFFLKNEPLTQEDIEKSTGYSRSAISRALDQLVKMGLIYKKRISGTRAFQYIMEKGLNELMIDGIDRWLKGIEILKQQTEFLISELPSEPPKNISIDTFDNLKSRIEEFNTISKKLMNIFDKLKKELLNEL
ncbi:MAG: GbsR/MarR family transcriptional regulator [Candidatus Helarchaeota archaeon]